MKKGHLFSRVLLTTALFLTLVPAAHGAEAYNPSRSYSGVFDSQKIYQHLKDSPKQRVVPGGYETSPLAESALCSEAQQQLRRRGFWKGGLRPDGSCGPDAPFHALALGNWLNYRKLGQ